VAHREKPELKTSGVHPGTGVFLDRDGVINKLIYHKDAGIVDSPFTLAQFELLPQVPKAIRQLNELGVPVIVVSNQPGIAKRHFSTRTLRTFDSKLKESLARMGAHVDAVYYCLHHPDSLVPGLRKKCNCRKPQIGMLRRAAKEFGISLSRSFMIGDGLTDIEAGARAGCTTIFVGRWKCECCNFIHPSGLRPAFVAKNLFEAVQQVRRVLAQSLPGQGFARQPLPGPSHTASVHITAET
jgi:D-glycero-D-manno-heptose 1,7-bisphosphate phosphatase